MEAGTGGAPAAQASTGDPQIDAALAAVEEHLTQATNRVSGDLGSLRDEVAKAQAAGQPVDHNVVISRLTAVLEVIDGIDPSQAVAGGTATAGTTAADGTGAQATGAAPAATGDQGAAAGEPAAAVAQGQDALAVYTFGGDPSTIDPAAWPKANVETEDGRVLHHYSGDSASGEQHGNGLDGGQWQVYTGAVRPVDA